ncbi:hypothetical protein CAL7716_087890 [Calothrix sp. PCC 7716]|nr:hypothetical protein CAL7716_087890 [Calothrix sp. PCC 7716]
MPKFDEHPTVKSFYKKVAKVDVLPQTTTLDATLLRDLCLEMGADDVGFIDIDRPEITN